MKVIDNEGKKKKKVKEFVREKYKSLLLFEIPTKLKKDGNFIISFERNFRCFSKIFTNYFSIFCLL